MRDIRRVGFSVGFMAKDIKGELSAHPLFTDNFTTGLNIGLPQL